MCMIELLNVTTMKRLLDLNVVNFGPFNIRLQNETNKTNKLLPTSLENSFRSLFFQLVKIEIIYIKI